MAYIYVRKDSPFYWLSFRGPDGVRRTRSTGFRHTPEHPIEIRKARALEARTTVEEIGHGHGKASGWGWVEDWLRLRYRHNVGVVAKYIANWRTLLLFLRGKADGPEFVTRQLCFDYVDWRCPERNDDLPPGCRRVLHNTALADLKTLCLVMGEAMKRQLIESNPCVRLGIRRDDVKRKAELTVEDVALIRQEIPKTRSELTRQMLHASFEIARYQGCRLAETRINLREDVDLRERRITFRTKTRKIHVTALHPELVPVIEDLIRQGKVYSWDAPEGKRPGVWAGKRWHEFWQRKAVAGIGKTFHSTRVTVVSELARNNVSRTKAMAFVGHSTSLVHSVYTRLRPDDLSDCVSAIGIRGPASA